MRLTIPKTKRESDALLKRLRGREERQREWARDLLARAYTFEEWVQHRNPTPTERMFGAAVLRELQRMASGPPSPSEVRECLSDA